MVSEKRLSFVEYMDDNSVVAPAQAGAQFEIVNLGPGRSVR